MHLCDTTGRGNEKNWREEVAEYELKTGERVTRNCLVLRKARSYRWMLALLNQERTDGEHYAE